MMILFLIILVAVNFILPLFPLFIQSLDFHQFRSIQQFQESMKVARQLGWILFVLVFAE